MSNAGKARGLARGKQKEKGGLRRTAQIHLQDTANLAAEGYIVTPDEITPEELTKPMFKDDGFDGERVDESKWTTAPKTKIAEGPFAALAKR